MRLPLWKISLTGLLLLLLPSCKKEIVPKEFYPRSDHEAYQHSLEVANLTGSALYLDWIEASDNSLKDPININLPFKEEFYWDSREARAQGYRFFVKRGVKIDVQIWVFSQDSLLLFSDLFRQRGDTLQEWTHVASADDSTHYLQFEPRRDGHYVLRLQPELMRGGRFRVLIRKAPSIGFPVDGRDSQAVLSFFGDPRDGGRRKHHGVDIFAPRHTPVLAPTGSTVTRVGEGEIGGNYVWLHDSKRSMYLYFAHLETQEVRERMKVEAGHIIGTVGNTGNARYTPPHLHFGIYRNGPIDPYHFIAETDTIAEAIAGDTMLLGKLVRSNQKIYVQSSSDSRTLMVDTLEKYSLMRVIGLESDLCCVLLPNGSRGYVPVKHVELANEIIKQEILTGEFALLEHPQGNSIKKEGIGSGATFTVLGAFKEYFYGTTREGANGWIRSL